jgi:uncharacterized membrane protein
VKTTYNQIAGQSVERLAALSDGVFAVAMTLLVLDLRAPAMEQIHSDHYLWRGLVALGPRLLMYAMSFMTLGIFWVGQQALLNHLRRSNRALSWFRLAFLFAVSITPFSTALLAQFTSYRVAFVAYWLNTVALCAALYVGWVCALGSGLVKEDLPPQASAAIKRRILTGQSWYAVAALLSVFDTRWSIAMIVLVRLNFAIAPRWPLTRHGRKPER